MSQIALSPQIAKSITLPPWVNDPTGKWVRVGEYAKIMRYAPSTVYDWLKDGTLAAFNVPVYKDARGRYWIRVTA